ncbi:hypothetical protein [Rhodococcus sp. NPDC049939]|uniref:hypothetical protein n=1 Tax=Rhodococcus sp. NPDC049939 TaxID=3155511 RepID=UPI0033F19E3F
MGWKVDRLREDVVLFSGRTGTHRADHRLTPSQLRALSHLDRGGPISARALAGFEQVAPQSIARLAALDTECTEDERELLFIAGRLLRRLADIGERVSQRESLMN